MTKYSKSELLLCCTIQSPYNNEKSLLLELTRHADHHFAGAKPYQILESKEGSPVLPYGYPAMLIMGYFPFIFKPVMAKQLAKYKVK